VTKFVACVGVFAPWRHPALAGGRERQKCVLLFADQVLIRRVHRMALAFGVSVFIFGHLHYKAEDRTYRGVRTRAGAGLVLILLVVGFPAPAQLKAGTLALLSKGDKPVHLVLVHVASKGKSRFGRKQDRDHGKSDDFGRP
jgi:hypothetical protein